MAFGYLRDPLFVACLAIYLVNRFILERVFAQGFCHAYVNDLICIPFWVPIMVFGLRKLRLRVGDSIPGAAEILIPLLVWSFTFEVLLPETDFFSTRTFADPHDVFCYTLGGLAATLFWRAWYRPRVSPGTPAGTRRAAP